MRTIQEIIASNLISLRKEKGLTQNELAEKLSYSDNMVSRWERGEITPSVETLQKISEFYNVSLDSLIKENTLKENSKVKAVQDMRKFSVILLLVAALWMIITVVFTYANSMRHINLWRLFILGAPLTCVIMLFFTGSWANRIYRFVVGTVLIWTTLAYIYLRFLEYNLFLIFTIGIPMQLALVVWTFIRPHSKKRK